MCSLFLFLFFWLLLHQLLFSFPFHFLDWLISCISLLSFFSDFSKIYKMNLKIITEYIQIILLFHLWNISFTHIYLHIYHLWHFSYPCTEMSFHLLVFCFCLKNFNTSYCTDLLVRNSLSFCCTEKKIYLHIWRIFLLDIKFYVDSFFFISILQRFSSNIF